MKKIIALLTVTGMLLMMVPAGTFAKAVNDDPATTDEQTEIAETADTTETPDEKEENVSPADNIVTTKHEAVIKGKKVSYTAKTGSMLLESGGEQCEMYFTAYTVDDADDKSERPITFAFNGGPGSSSYYIHMGCLGPRKVELDARGNALSLPAKLIDNENSVLDMTDLVFIDPVGTGFSHAVDESKNSEFWGYDNDIRSVGDFIRQYINRNKRWGSEKYIAGESYGTARAVGLCKYLADTYSIYLNGLMLLSTVNDYSAVIESPGNDMTYSLILPTFAADAWYHGCLEKKYQDMELEKYLDEVRSFVEKEYVPGLFKGNKLTGKENEELAAKIAAYTGLPVEFVLEKNNRITMSDFCSELLKDKNLIVGRLDARITGPATGGTIESGASDPSNTSVDLAMTNTYLHYLTDELGFQTDKPYIPLSFDVNGEWDYSENWYQGHGLGYLAQEDIIKDCMSKNRFLKVWVICGYYDTATPFYSAEWTYSHVFVNDELKGNLLFTYYPSGHMFYVDKESFDSFRADAENWYAGQR